MRCLPLSADIGGSRQVARKIKRPRTRDSRGEDDHCHGPIPHRIDREEAGRCCSGKQNRIRQVQDERLSSARVLIAKVGLATTWGQQGLFLAPSGLGEAGGADPPLWRVDREAPAAAAPNSNRGVGGRLVKTASKDCPARAAASAGRCVARGPSSSSELLLPSAGREIGIIIPPVVAHTQQRRGKSQPIPRFAIAASFLILKLG